MGSLRGGGLARETVWLIVGTRPEAVKMAPVADALRDAGVNPFVAATGQHADMAPPAMREAGLHCGLRMAGSGTRAPAAVVADVTRGLSVLLASARPAMVLVQGDTASALGGALAATYARVPLGHVEAGLRTGDTDAPWPEELHRRMIGQVASVHFAPTAGAAAALAADGVPAGAVHVTGNTGIDALFAAVARGAAVPELPPGDGPLLMVTAHRRENQGAPLAEVCRAVRRLAVAGCRVVWPVHPAPDVLGPVHAALDGVAGVRLTGPLGHGAAAALMAASDLVLTDSGGVQEEAPALGRRVLVLRDVTERPEGVAAGAARVVGTDADRIVPAVWAALAAGPIAPCLCYGDGRAGERIAAIVAGMLGLRGRGRRAAA